MIEIAERAGRLEVSGVQRRDLEQALVLLPLVQELQAEGTAVTREQLVRALMRHRVHVTPRASVEQAQRLAAHRDALLASDVFSHASLAALRGDRQVSSTRTWVTRRRKDRALFTVTHEGRTLLPAFQFTDAGQTRPELQPLLRALLDAGIDGWELWTWLTSSSSFLSGGAPAQVARTHPQRALHAAERFAASAAA